MATTTTVDFADKTVDDLTLCGRWASIALREQIAEIQDGVPALVYNKFHIVKDFTVTNLPAK